MSDEQNAAEVTPEEELEATMSEAQVEDLANEVTAEAEEETPAVQEEAAQEGVAEEKSSSLNLAEVMSELIPNKDKEKKVEEQFGEEQARIVAQAVVSAAKAADQPVDVEKSVAHFLNQFRTYARFLPGNWYIVHSYSGHERKVKANLEQRASTLGMENYIHEVLVPMEEIVEMKNTQRKKITRVRMPGYVMVRMGLDNDNAVLRLVKDTPAVTGFVGDSRLKDREDQIPTPLSFQEVYNMIAPGIEQSFLRALEEVAVATPEAAVKVEFEIGETVMVVNGPFTGQSASVAEIMPESKKLVVTLTLFGRDTQTELAMTDVSKEE
ncbi:transcription termination/antitermination factor NusG [Boudabousia tangfeifanii]|uniref:Transcription termination/antitermination protein NusG n=1 Tax=Boudabousia tangfeifanii TaxID=1912795 RepID=A0A1D9MIS4_9ACTO|nr:transcription termination/antitermination protein NusG [Boudabousia tangfeifanii]AOZ72207.1 transcription termination/antitermination factor NusG [Boudabousia tangfeifanii]